MTVPRQRVVRLGAGAAVAAAAALGLSASGTAARQAATPAAASGGRPNLLALDLGARVERATSRYDFSYGPYKLLDDDPATVWTSSSSVVPQEVVFAFAGRDSVLVSGLTITLPKPGTDPGWGGPNDGKVWAKDIEVWASSESPTAGFAKVAAASLPMATGAHPIALAAPVRARFIKLVVSSNHGSPRYAVIADVAVQEGTAPGYQPLLQRHADLAELLAGRGAAAPSPAPMPQGIDLESCAAAEATEPPRKAESRSVLVVGKDPEAYGPYRYAKQSPESPSQRYFASAPGDGRLDSAIYRRLTFWSVPPDAARPSALVPSVGVDTVVLSQICDAKTSLGEPFKRALSGWVARGNKLIIQDSDGCGQGSEPDYSFLPLPLKTANAGARGVPGALRFVESSALASDDPASPSWIDMPSWQAKANGNPGNDLGDSNLITDYGAGWCGALTGSNSSGARGFVLAYARRGRGTIIYDGVDFDQFANVAYRQYVTRQLALPFDPDPLPCSSRVAPFVITAEGGVRSRQAVPGETVTYALSVLSVLGFKGTVALSATAAGGAAASIAPASVTLGDEQRATLTLRMPSPMPERLAVGVTGRSGNATGLLCLILRERRSGRLTVGTDFGNAGKPAASRKNLLFILDLSGSMRQPLGKGTRIGTARQVMRDVVAKLPADFNVGLRVYGHRAASTQKGTCTDTELVVPMGRANQAGLLKQVDALQPRGETPLVYSVLQGAGDLKGSGGGNLVLITDGEESCGGDLEAAKAALKKLGVDLTLNIVGFTLAGAQARAPLAGLAGSTGGAYLSAKDGPSLARAIVAAATDRFPYKVLGTRGETVAAGDAGDAGAELPAGTYRVVVQAGADDITLEGVAVVRGADTKLRVVRKGDRFAVER
jgi:hypothetical protein